MAVGTNDLVYFWKRHSRVNTPCISYRKQRFAIFRGMPTPRSLKLSTVMTCCHGDPPKEWLSVIGYLIPEALGRRVFQLFAQSGGLAWTVADFITFLCVCVLDSRQEHVSVMFQVCICVYERLIVKC